MEQTTAHLRYLMAIYQVFQSRQEISSVEVARLLGVSKPAVARMLKLLAEKGLIEKKPYGRIHLTEKGIFLSQEYQAQAERICRAFPGGELALTPEEISRAAEAALAALPAQRFFDRYESLFGSAPEQPR